MLCIIPIRHDWRQPLSGVQKVAAVSMAVLLCIIVYTVSHASTLEKQCRHMESEDGGYTQVLGMPRLLPLGACLPSHD